MPFPVRLISKSTQRIIDWGYFVDPRVKRAQHRFQLLNWSRQCRSTANLLAFHGVVQHQNITKQVSVGRRLLERQEILWLKDAALCSTKTVRDLFHLQQHFVIMPRERDGQRLLVGWPEGSAGQIGAGLVHRLTKCKLITRWWTEKEDADESSSCLWLSWRRCCWRGAPGRGRGRGALIKDSARCGNARTRNARKCSQTLTPLSDKMHATVMPATSCQSWSLASADFKQLQVLSDEWKKGLGARLVLLAGWEVPSTWSYRRWLLRRSTAQPLSAVCNFGKERAAL